MVEYDKYCFKLKKTKYVKKRKNAYCLVCEKKTDNKNVKGEALENKIGQINQRALVMILKDQLF